MKKLFYSLFSFFITVGAANAQNTFPAPTATTDAKLSGSIALEFGGGVVKEVNAGKIGYQKFSDALDIIGAGTTPTNRKLKFWAEGGASFTGSVWIGTPLSPYIAPTGLFEVRSGTLLGSSAGSSQLITSTTSASGTNYFQNNVWVMRDIGGGSDWLSTRLHNAISIDLSFLTPGVNTRTWWDRSPYKNIQSWGDVNTTYMSLNQGRLNIGAASSFGTQYLLAVAGSIGAWGEVRVFTTGTPFPDYVFDPTYKLPNLEATEKFVKENRHLPEVPSAADIEKDGMSLNGMNVILLKKVEELTLYMIEMKKKTEELEKEIKELKELQKRK
jgi:hypothetical protein